ncbi:hypothetical protein KY290_036182 [Solanum tuberosum]|uniref:Uncharacterized protein n=1 Tax=Solanum tuberosum TaxID=4113 RepID=A0ABQ7TTJ6_SOLTU|nr:hypothetical protein KY285_035462 [Solanum tuberosum]KAH0737477.1 hypothetical protein KY290_036182 [Solanum tuberosum]
MASYKQSCRASETKGRIALHEHRYIGNVGQPMDCIKDKAQATQNLTFEMAQSAKRIAHNKITGAAHTTKDKMSRAAKAMKDKVA